MSTLVELLLGATVIVLGLSLIGYPIARVAMPDWRSGEWSIVPMFGLAGFQVAAWSWLAVTGAPMQPVAPALLVIGAAATIWLVVRRGSRPRPSRPRRIGLLVVLFGAASIFVVHYEPVWSRHAHTQPQGGTADVAGYVLLADHLVERGFDDPGGMIGHDLSDQARRDVFGAYAYLGFVGQITPGSTWTASLAALLATFVLLAVAVYDVTSAYMQRSFVTTGLVACCSVASFFVVYSLTQYFLSQFIAMTAVPLTVLIVHRSIGASDRRTLLGLAGALAAVVVVLDMTYPQMLFAGLPVALMAGVAAGILVSWRARRLPLGQVIAVLMLGVLAGLAACTTRAPSSIRRTLQLSDAEAGWPLPKVTPVELLGFQRTFHTVTPDAFVWGSIAVVSAAAVGSACLVWRRRLGPVALGLSAAVLYASYVYVYDREGVSYRQWKWLSYIAPLIIAGTLAPIIGAVGERAGVGATSRAVRRAGPSLLVLFALVIQMQNAREFSSWMDREVGVPDDLVALGHLRDYVGDERAVNVNISAARTGSSVWETQWVAYFARDIDAYLLSANLMALAPPCATWTLMRRDDAEIGVAEADMRVINDTYALLRLPAPQGLKFGATYRFPLLPGEDLQTLFSSGPDGDPNTLVVHRLADGQSQLVFLRGTAEVLRSEPMQIEPGAIRHLDVNFGYGHRLIVRMDGEVVLEGAPPFNTTFGRGLLLGSNGTTVAWPPFEGTIEPVLSAPPDCELVGS